MNVAKPVPKGFHTVTPYITAQHADKVIAFMQQAFGAEFDHEPMKRPDGSLMHATLRIGDSMVMIAQAMEPAKAMPASLYLYLPMSMPPISSRSRRARRRSWSRQISSTAIAAAA